jgi:hypothetical protein
MNIFFDQTYKRMISSHCHLNVGQQVAVTWKPLKFANQILPMLHNLKSGLTFAMVKNSILVCDWDFSNE